jgi:hypothetical protein
MNEIIITYRQFHIIYQISINVIIKYFKNLSRPFDIKIN